MRHRRVLAGRYARGSSSGGRRQGLSHHLHEVGTRLMDAHLRQDVAVLQEAGCREQGLFQEAGGREQGLFQEAGCREQGLFGV